MARPTYVYSIDHVARMIDESLELIEVVSWNSDDIDDGEMIQVYNGTDENLTTFTECGVECLQEFLADVRTWDSGIRQFLLDRQSDPGVIERIMAYEKKPETRRSPANAYADHVSTIPSLSMDPGWKA